MNIIGKMMLYNLSSGPGGVTSTLCMRPLVAKGFLFRTLLHLFAKKLRIDFCKSHIAFLNKELHAAQEPCMHC